MKLIMRLFGLAAIVVGAIVGTGYVVAQNANQTLSSLLSTDLIQVYRYTTAAITYASPDTISNYARSTQLLYTTTATAASTGTTAEQTLATYSIPANTLNTGTRIRVGGSWTLAANADTKTVKCYFGASVISSGALTTNNKNASCQLEVVETGAATQEVYGNMLVDVTPITGYVNAGTDSGTSAIVVKLTATQGSAQAADVIMNSFWVERIGN